MVDEMNDKTENIKHKYCSNDEKEMETETKWIIAFERRCDQVTKRRKSRQKKKERIVSDEQT